MVHLLTSWLRRHAMQMIAATAVSIGWFALYLEDAHLDNLSTVTPGLMLRASQPWPSDLDYLQQRYGLAGVLNLRRVVPGVDWYDAQHRWCRQADVPCYDVPIGLLPEPEQMQTLTRSIREGDGPVLIHCEFGEVRTGKLAAGFRVLIEGVGPQRAFDEMARFRYRPTGQERELVLAWLHDLAALRTSATQP